MQSCVLPETIDNNHCKTQEAVYEVPRRLVEGMLLA